MPGVSRRAGEKMRTRCRSASTWTATRPDRRARAGDPFTIGYLRAHRAGEGAARAGRGLPRAARRGPAWATVAAASPPAIWRPSISAISTDVTAQDGDLGTRGGVRVPRRGRPRAARSRSCTALDVFSVPATYDEPKGCSCSKRWPPACRSCSRGAARSPRSRAHRRRLAGRARRAEALADGLLALWRDPERAARAGRSRRRRRARALQRRDAWPRRPKRCTRA